MLKTRQTELHHIFLEAMAAWTEEMEEQLSAVVEERPSVYNLTLQCHSTRNRKDKLWSEIESELLLLHNLQSMY